MRLDLDKPVDKLRDFEFEINEFSLCNRITRLVTLSQKLFESI